MKQSLQMIERAADGDTDPEVLNWVRESCLAYLGGTDLACAFGLGQHERKREARRLLAELAKLLDDGRCSRWELAMRVEQKIKQFESRVWPRVQLGSVRPAAPSDVLLCRLFRCRTQFPREQRRIYDIAVKRSGPKE
ncbi:hypothetical protein [Hydrogenophaga sp. OTU3427]|uniref:hypothetical protein n=1 Tax=Hydrogenophaga sp. OTU3427 TaxID=3043856 RepID=UPI00313BE188